MIVPGRPLTGLLRTATTMSEGKRTMKERIALIVHRPRMLKVTLAAVAVIVAAVVVLTFGGSWEDAQAEAGAVEDPAETGGAQPAPGIAEAIRAGSMQITRRAMLSREASVIRNQTLIVNLPGSPKAVKECLDLVLDQLDHGIRILTGRDSECARK